MQQMSNKNEGMSIAVFPDCLKPKSQLYLKYN